MRCRTTLRSWLGPVMLLAMTGAAHAQEEAETVGMMTGLLDGQEREWFILSQGVDSNATFTELGDRACA